jgi:hypothetical protein
VPRRWLAKRNAAVHNLPPMTPTKQAVPASLLGAAASAVPITVIALGGLDQASRQVLRRPLAEAIGFSGSPSALLVLVLVVLAGLALLWRWRGRGSDRLVATTLVLLFVGGMYAQRELGARLQSDGLRYYAYLRSIAFDHDVNLVNDYHLLGLDGDPAMTRLTARGYLPSPFAIGPAVAWLPSVMVGHAATLGLNHFASAGQKADGTAFPYRQAVCIASLFYGLLGCWFSYKLAARFVDRSWAAGATFVFGLASFVVWYLVQEPSMSHAVSMCSSAAFLYAWAVARERRTVLGWGILGLLAGITMMMRWQNAVLLLLPAVEWLRLLWSAKSRAPGGPGIRHLLASAGTFVGLALVGFLPQMLACQAIYGAPFAVSPLSPQMFWGHPAMVLLLFSSRNGLFSFSPVVYGAAIGLVLLPRRDRVFGACALAIVALSIYVNASVEDWWAGASFGARRFDQVVPLFVVGLAVALVWLRDLVAARPAWAVSACLLALVAWNFSLMAVARGTDASQFSPGSFGLVSSRQVEVLHRWVGHPFSYPANLWFALRNGLSPARYDWLAFEFLSEPSRPYGKIDIGRNDELYLLDGWYGGEADPDGTTWRWTAAESGVLVPLDHPAPLLLQARLIPFTYPASPEASVAARVNGRPFGPVTVRGGSDWQRVEIPVPSDAWHAGVNRVEWMWLSAAAPAKVGTGPDNRILGARVDFVRVQVAQ